mgnify:CR=1 FL=1|tara:strand:+ start:4983 stop:6512 length:1530 start_codon:yes stop_codon:yes gene_type:complete
MLNIALNVNKSRASIYNLIFTYISSFIQIFNSIILLPLYLSFFTLTDYGAWVASAAIIHIFLIIDPGLSSVTTTKLSQAFSADDDSKFQSIFLSGILLALFMALLTYILGMLLLSIVPSLIVYEGGRQDEIDLAMHINIIALALTPLASVLHSYFQALLQTFVGSVLYVCSIIISPFTIIFCLFNDWGIASLPMGIMASNIFAVFVYSLGIIYFWTKYTNTSFFIVKNLNFSTLFHDVKYLYLKRFSSALSENLETSFAGIFFNTQVSGSVAIIKKLISSIQLFSNGVATSTYSSLSHAFEENNPYRLKNALNKTLYATDLIQVIGICILFLAYKPFIFIWLGQEITQGYLFMILLAFSSFMYIKSNLLYTMLASNGLFKETSLIFVLEIAVRLVGTYLLIKVISLYALPVAAILGSATTLLILSFILIKKSGISLKEILISFNLYESMLFTLSILLGYFINYPSNMTDAIYSGLITLVPFIFFVLLGKKLRTFLLEVYKSYILRAKNN